MSDSDPNPTRPPLDYGRPGTPRPRDRERAELWEAALILSAPLLLVAGLMIAAIVLLR
jgi:hypothetical protein